MKQTFKVGDLVRVMKRVGSQTGFSDVWTPKMDNCIGLQGTIASIHYGGAGIRISGILWLFPSNSLTLVCASNKVKDEAKAKKFVHLVRNIRTNIVIEVFDSEVKARNYIEALDEYGELDTIKREVK